MSRDLRTTADQHDVQWLARTLGRPKAFPLPASDLKLLAGTLQSRSLPSGRTLFQAGTFPKGVWAIREGIIELVQPSNEREHCVRLLRAGETVGDLEILQGQAARFTVRTVRSSSLLYMSASDFCKALSLSATLCMRWASKLALQVGQNQDRVTELLPNSLIQRTARLLVDQASNGPLDLSQSTIARMLGAHRSPLNQALKELERAQLISLSYRRIEVLDLAALSDIARLGPLGLSDHFKSASIPQRI